MIYGIALGSNLGDRLHHLQEAVRQLRTVHPTLILRGAAAVYETDPVDCPEGSQSFLNTVVEVECALEPLELLREMRAVEVKLGRPAEHGHHAPRTVDLDMLYADDTVMEQPALILPHPRMTQRRFVLQPLAEIRPKLVLPNDSRSISQHLETLQSPEPPLRILQRDWLR
ncbi:2-amino-4-hydroxy-6-hydroxymethyldihydropteridine diphosphokinase [Roseimicrobium sp. ORNL1]|uniref:2-amino-4-hydroxy-6- hydroxymethyldihydropteridine diphosphokinase n=1 Tax=Roseimicrobium sp. ORNL1 TaxID=2711231 RepID=UPI0013E10418|nr:2-amino-4-hydroxy-6-hydroxymethyldihydropteridine diphosphokinase [Roseimicrobium sp. ORNL1]QIF03480.1 2-amino-4-hydroxy-6-hydroxymethyldihydropteridine diphosphokinase [Roseimicrobium sp. ORNL1]